MIVQEAYVNINHHNGCSTITFYSPKSNSLPSHILQQLAAAISAEGENKNCKVILLKSAGESTFCAGASFDELMAITTEEEGFQFFSGFAAVINAIRICPKFVLCRVQGKATGGGVGIAAAADYTLATEAAAIKLSELAVGIGPMVVGPAVERKMGTSAAYELAIDATTFRPATWAMQKGLYANIYLTIPELDVAIVKLIQILTLSSPQAMTEIKKAFWVGTEHWHTLLPERAVISGKLVLSEFTKNYIASFKAK